jgi:hypothetical protein
VQERIFFSSYLLSTIVISVALRAHFVGKFNLQSLLREERT